MSYMGFQWWTESAGEPLIRGWESIVCGPAFSLMRSPKPASDRGYRDISYLLFLITGDGWVN